MAEERIQTIAFIRHGVALHNLRRAGGSDPNGPDLANPYFWDPSLVPFGWEQAKAAGERLRTWLMMKQQQPQHMNNNNNNRPDDVSNDKRLVRVVVLTSPLTRCIQTTLAVCGMTDGDNNVATTTNNNQETQIICWEDLREAFGIHYPDKRRTKSFLMQSYPQIHFDPEMTEEDELWSPTQRERLHNLQYRVSRFLHRLCQLLSWQEQQQTRGDNAKNVVVLVVSHGLWMEACFQMYCPDALPNGERVHNCDLFGGECVSVQGSFVRLQNIRRIQ